MNPGSSLLEFERSRVDAVAQPIGAGPIREYVAERYPLDGEATETYRLARWTR